MNDLAETPQVPLSEAAELVLGDLRQPSLAQIWITCVAVMIDIPILGLAFWFAQYAALPALEFSPLAAGAVALVAAVTAATGLTITSSYASRILRSPLRSLPRLAVAVAFPAVFMSLLLPTSAPAFLFSAMIALACAALPLRLGSAAMLNWIFNMRLLDRRAVIAGGGEHALSLIRGLRKLPDNDVRVYGIFDDRDDIRSPTQVLGVPKLGGYTDLLTFARSSEIDMVIVALPLKAERRIIWLLDALRVLPVEVRLSAFSEDFSFAKPEQSPLISAIQHNFAAECRLTKRLFDIFFASIALIPALPIMLGAAIAIRLDSKGPIFFHQRRHGYSDRTIEILKFRSMYHDSADPNARNVVTRGDPRVTRVGRILRRTSIDELPQLFNVLRGDLSLVGPRPHAINAVSSQKERFTRIVDGYSARHRLPPGITGWAQINGWRGEIDDPEKLRARFEHDLYYIENWSIWLDLKILFRTPLSLLDGRSAY
ncbi:Undecaprenyl-phosphate glucose phosphotransferase [Poseidonocella pacifica]|uniref:Undecaprenyl-phosphate glucose phosphotransferase n=1 Tax=Poseidonocella pacifica TaxID=871651 RepID=A0A1I0VRI9_9RHOB|nr:exopolysaccharide biosynthesis polyprenyl glycosylphosphotransferase [Poseidonocella pacifica]SFA78306.1 Undecaprenyl-phosphate glucose phosphotransferase [Poseidonocella pacifica]